MEKFTFNRSSLHYRLALHPWYGGRSRYPAYVLEDYVDNSCAYIRHLIKGVFFMFVLTIAWSIGLLFPLDFLVWIAAMVVTAQLIAPGVPAAVTLIFIVLGTVGVIWAVLMDQFNYYSELRRRKGYKNRQSPSQPSIVVKLYRSWKDKYCVPIEYVD